MPAKADAKMLERNQKIVNLYKTGLNMNEVGKQFGIGGVRVGRILKELDCPINQRKKMDLVGERFQKLLVLSFHGMRGKNQLWLCKCDCGNEVIVTTGSLNSDHTKSCGCYKRYERKNRIKHGQCIRGKKSVEYNIFVAAKRRAKQKNLPFNLELSDIVIPEYCPVFPDIKLESNKKVIGQNSPTLDRLIPEDGYIKGNVVVISNRANFMKNKYNLEELQMLTSWLEKELKLQKRKHLKVVGVK